MVEAVAAVGGRGPAPMGGARVQHDGIYKAYASHLRH